MMPGQPDEVLVAERRYRHADGREVILRARIGRPHAHGLPLFGIEVVTVDGAPAPGFAGTSWMLLRDHAWRAWATRGRQLRAAGYRPEPPAASAAAS